MTFPPATAARASSVFLDPYTAGGTGEQVAIVRPRLWQPDGKTPAVLYCHGSGTGGVATSLYADAIPTVVGATTYQTNGIYGVAHRIAEAGYLVVCADFGGVSTWGNSTVVARMELARAWCQGPPYYAKPGPVAVVGGSMGAMSAVQYFRTYPANVSCTVRIIPLSDLNRVRTYNDGDSSNAGFRDWINLAWGAALGSTNTYPTQITGTAWSAATSYNPFDVVTRLGIVYHSTAAAGDNLNAPPESSPTKWVSIPAATSNVTLSGIGDPALHLSDLATLNDLVYYATDDRIIYPPTVLTMSNATATKEAHPITGFGGHTDATIAQVDMARVITFLQQYAPLPTGEPY